MTLRQAHSTTENVANRIPKEKVLGTISFGPKNIRVFRTLRTFYVCTAPPWCGNILLFLPARNFHLFPSGHQQLPDARCVGALVHKKRNTLFPKTDHRIQSGLTATTIRRTPDSIPFAEGGGELGLGSHSGQTVLISGLSYRQNRKLHQIRPG